MKKKLLVLLFSLVSLGLVSCGGGNDVASTGATAVSAAASATTTTATASAPSTSATTATEPKVNGQIDERTGVAPVAAQMTIAQTPTACMASATYGGTGPLLTTTTTPTLAQCSAALPGIATGNPWTVYSNGGCATSSSLGGTGPALTQSQLSACNNAMSSATTRSQCSALGVYSNSSTAAQYCGVD